MLLNCTDPKSVNMNRINYLVSNYIVNFKDKFDIFLVDNSAKLKMLDKLLTKLKQNRDRVLFFHNLQACWTLLQLKRPQILSIGWKYSS